MGRFIVKSFPHDFGSYYEVCAVFNDNDEASSSWAYNVEAHIPEYWDEIAKAELALKEVI